MINCQLVCVYRLNILRIQSVKIDFHFVIVAGIFLFFQRLPLPQKLKRKNIRHNIFTSRRKAKILLQQKSASTEKKRAGKENEISHVFVRRSYLCCDETLLNGKLLKQMKIIFHRRKFSCCFERGKFASEGKSSLLHKLVTFLRSFT